MLDRPLMGVAASAPSPPRDRTEGGAERRTGSGRLLAVDLLRGAIMIVMSWDHARDFLAQHKVAQHGSEKWSGLLSNYDNNLLVFFQRWITHFCAPGFFFTMGFSMYMMATSRMEKHRWSSANVVSHFLKRGLILIVVGRIVDLAILPELIPISVTNQTLFPAHRPAPNSSSHGSPSSSPFRGPLWLAPLIGIWEVMTALGFTMTALGFMVPVLIYLDRRVHASGRLLSVLLGAEWVACEVL